MANGREYSSRQRKAIGNYYEHIDTIVAQKLGEIVSDLYLQEDPRRANTLWKSALTQLKKTKADANHVNNVIASRDVEKLAALVNELTADPGAAAQRAAESQIDEETLKKAMRAFRTKLKSTQLDEDSRLGVGPLSSEKGRVDAIEPPREFPTNVWTELVKRGELRKARGGFYELVK